MAHSTVLPASASAAPPPDLSAPAEPTARRPAPYAALFPADTARAVTATQPPRTATVRSKRPA